MNIEEYRKRAKECGYSDEEIAEMEKSNKKRAAVWGEDSPFSKIPLIPHRTYVITKNGWLEN